LASSSFGKTQIEEEAQLRKRQREDKRTQRMTMLHSIEGKKRPEEIGGGNDDDDKLSNCCNDDFCNNPIIMTQYNNRDEILILNTITATRY